jgi:hypothetical protein
MRAKLDSSSHPLAKVADPGALDAAAGPRGRVKITVPLAWLNDGAELEIITPRLLSCDRCGGGGCDGCERSGAFRGPKDEAKRTLRVSLAPQDESGVVIRLASPFDEGEIDQLMVRVTAGQTASQGVRLVPKLALVVPPKLDMRLVAAAAVLALLVLAFLLR